MAGPACAVNSKGVEESITALAAQGLSFGVHVVLSASRWAEIRPSLKDQIGTRIELRLGDPADSEVDRKRAQQVPRDRPGRGLSREGLHMLIALPGEGVEVRRDGGLVAPPIPLLPARVEYEELVASDELNAGILLGVDERRLQPVAVDFERSPHLLILGDNDCGKTTALRMLCREIVRTKTAAQAQLLIVDFRRTLLGVVESEHLGGYAMSPAALQALLPGLVESLRRRMPPPDVSQAQLLARSWWSGPDLYVVVDDYDLVATSTGNPLLAVLEYLPYATDLGLHVIVARRSGGAARALFEPLLAGLRDLGCMAIDDERTSGRRPAVGVEPSGPAAAGPRRPGHWRRRRGTARPGGLESAAMSSHRAVIEAGPGSIRRLCCGTEVLGECDDERRGTGVRSTIRWRWWTSGRLPSIAVAAALRSLVAGMQRSARRCGRRASRRGGRRRGWAWLPLRAARGRALDADDVAVHPRSWLLSRASSE